MHRTIFHLSLFRYPRYYEVHLGLIACIHSPEPWPDLQLHHTLASVKQEKTKENYEVRTENGKTTAIHHTWPSALDSPLIFMDTTSTDKDK